MSINEMLMAAAGSAGGDKLYVEDCFATHLYTGNSSTQSITNGIDLSGKGGLVWIKGRTVSGHNNNLYDTVRGATNQIVSNQTSASTVQLNGLTNFTSTGFTLSVTNGVNQIDQKFVSWTFREQAKFFDVVTYTGNGSNRTIAHNLGSVPGMILVKRTDTTSDWNVYHRSLGNTKLVYLNNTSSEQTISTTWNSTSPTSSEFTVGTDTDVNANGGTFVAYLFAHNAGGFGAAGTDNIISCGSYTYSGGANPEINLGFEPQWVMRKRTDSTSNWEMVDIMRGMPNNTANAQPALQANLSSAESSTSMYILPTATGFIDANCANSSTYIYMAIRRPMKTPTSGTEVFAPVAAAAGSSTTITTNFPVDMVLLTDRSTSWVYNTTAEDRLRGGTIASITSSTDAERTDNASKFDSNISFVDGWSNLSTRNIVYHAFRRATGFFDVVCYAGTGSTTTQAHNLGVAPELIIIKNRSGAFNWTVGSVYLPDGWSNPLSQVLYLNTTAASAQEGYIHTVTNTSFSVVGVNQVGAGGSNYVAYLFASVAGVSKVGNYTGNGSNQTINCGFTAGARFVLIKRTDSTGDWCVFDTARGIVSGNDPFLQLNSTAAEVTSEDAVDPTNSGFIVNETTEALNTNNATYIYLAIA